MENSTIQKDYYPFCEDYTDNMASVYGNLALQELKIPVKERIRSLAKCETRYSNDISLYDKRLDSLMPQKNKNSLNYICQSLNWTGYVIDIREDSFTAKLIDNSENSTYEIADFDIKDISESDLSLLTIGATFYWSIGYANQYGQVIKQSFVRFKRSISLGVQEFDSIIDNVKTLKEKISWE